jgi:hypothetical protein
VFFQNLKEVRISNVEGGYVVVVPYLDKIATLTISVKELPEEKTEVE